MKLTAAAQAKSTLAKSNAAVLIYGPSKSGKTRLAATSAQVPRIKKVVWLDIENGSATLSNMGLTEAELDKIQLIKVSDTRDNPRAVETTLKMLTSKTALKICDQHGTVDCKVCTGDYPHEMFLLSDLTKEDVLVIDSGSQLATSAMNASMRGRPATAKAEFDDYGFQGKLLSDALLVIQQAANTNFIVITHELLAEGEDGIEKIYPLMGTRSFSSNVPKYFGTVIHTHIKMAKHTAASTSTYKSNLVTGSRTNLNLEKEAVLSMEALLK